MSAPKPGDRVKVSYEGVWGVKEPAMFVEGWVTVDGFSRGVPKSATVEVLASPVYVNHDTTEMKPDDIWRVVDPSYPEDSSTAFVNEDGESYWISPTPIRVRFNHPKRLLVRDGQVIA